jgi:type III pantothenate kinase
MNLTIDIGNSLIKTAVFFGDEAIAIHSFLPEEMPELYSKVFSVSKGDVQSAIISSVIGTPSGLIEKLKEKKVKTIFLDQDTPVPIINLYKTPDTLGKDRLASVIGAYSVFPGKNILVIDIGTCIKYDFINENKEYLGGGISPGLLMRYKALNTFTKKLPLLSSVDKADLIGSSTNDSIWSGVQNGMAEEIKGIINRYTFQIPDVKIIFTGGDLNFFEKDLKNSIFVEPYLVLRGLNEILRFNNVGFD